MVEVTRKNLFICNRCIQRCALTLGDGAGEEAPEPVVEPGEDENALPEIVVRKPREVKAYMDEYVIGQDHAKRDVAVAVYQHYKRYRALRDGVDLGVEIEKDNILVLGPTGCGKTHIARTVARMLGVPFYVGDATKLTMTGYVGEDVESLLQGLIADAEGNIKRAEWGIIFLDESDKLARKSGRSVSGFRDVTGEGVQQSLLKLIEGSRVKVPRGMAPMMSPNQPVDMIDTANILFIFAGSFAGIEEIIRDRINKNAAVGFGATARRDVDDHEIFLSVEEEDFLEFGVIPELLGRLPVRTSLLPLTEQQLVQILTEPKNSIVKQYQALYRIDGIDLQFDEEALLAIGREAIARTTGGRALRTIMAKVMKPYSYDAPSDDDIIAIRITKEVVEGKSEAFISRRQSKLLADPLPDPDPPEVVATA